ncbi:MAG: site-specific DNA-methyltransferase [Bacillota bacterium]
MADLKMNGQTLDIEQINKNKLQELFPECFFDGKLDTEKLLALCGEAVDDSFEKYKFEWKGKYESLKLAQKRSTGTLRPCKDESVDFDETKNLYIEGDNLEVLKLLQTAYYGKIKMIYIDPPYNTGNDFVYQDDFADPIAKYKEVTGQATKSNPETMGRYHTNWLNMMYPRLRLASNLLTDDGVIFISIDDDELFNLKKICDEVFGEENFIGKIVHKNNSSKNQSKLMSISTEYILIYAKNKVEMKDVVWRIRKKGVKDVSAKFTQLKNKGLSLAEISLEIKEMYARPKYSHLSRWNKVDDNGVFKDADLSRENGPRNYTIINPNTGKECVIPNRGWGKSYEELLRLQAEDLIWYGDDTTPPGLKDYINDDDVSVPDNFWYFDNSVDTRWIKNTFGSLIFENPKPLDMIKQLLGLHLGHAEECTILDFFSGSGTTAHSVMQLNAEDGGNRKFIMVQLPEKTDEKKSAYKAGYENICEIGKERIRRAGAKIKEENSDKEGLDVGFKVFKLDTSNLKQWDSTPIANGNVEELHRRIDEMVYGVKEDRNAMDVVSEIMLKLGMPLDVDVSYIEVNEKIVYVVGDLLLLICLEQNITAEDIEEMASYAPAKIVCAEHGFANDSALSNAHYILKEKKIDLRLI